MKKMLSVLLAGTMVLSMAGCQKTAAPAEGETKGAVETTGQAVENTTSGGVDKSKELIVYTNSASEGRDAWLVEKAAEPSSTIRPRRARSASPAVRTLPSKKYMALEGQKKLTTTRLGATAPLARSEWNSPGLWKMS